MSILKRGCIVLVLIVAAACGGSDTATSPSASGRVIGLSGNLAFGTVTIGQSANATLTITNSGNQTLTVSGMTVPAGSGSVYFASWTNGAILPGASQSVNIRFAPLAAQSYNGTLTVNGDQTGGTNTIAISGTGQSSSPPSPIPNPAPPAGQKYDGTYDFRIEEPQAGGTKTTISVGQYFRVVNGKISSPDGVLSGAVDTFGAATFTSACPFGAQDPATYTGILNVGAGPTGNFGQGTYSCVNTPTYNWFVNNGK